MARLMDVASAFPPDRACRAEPEARRAAPSRHHGSLSRRACCSRGPRGPRSPPAGRGKVLSVWGSEAPAGPAASPPSAGTPSAGTRAPRTGSRASPRSCGRRSAPACRRARRRPTKSRPAAPGSRPPRRSAPAPAPTAGSARIGPAWTPRSQNQLPEGKALRHSKDHHRRRPSTLAVRRLLLDARTSSLRPTHSQVEGRPHVPAQADGSLAVRSAAGRPPRAASPKPRRL